MLYYREGFYALKKLRVSEMDRFIKTAPEGAQSKTQKRDPISFFTAIWKNKYTIWAIILLMAVNAYVMMMLYNPGWYPGSSYILNHYLLSYELAFMPRSLAGTVYQSMLYFMSPKTFFLLFLFFQLFLYLMLTLYFHRCISQNDFSSGADFLFLTYLLLPSTYLAFFDFGRLDILLLALAFAAVLLIRSHRRCALVLIPGIITAGVLIHEAFWFFYVPTIFAWSVFYVNRSDKKSFLLPAGVVLGCVVSLGLLFLMRKNMPGGSEIMSFLASKNQLTHTSDSIMSFSMYAGDGVKPKSYLDHFNEVFFTPSAVMLKDLRASLSAFAVCMILPVWIFKKVFDAGNDRQEKLKTVLLFLASLSPLGLCVIAFDFGRWCTAGMWCVFLTLFSLISIYHDRKISIPQGLMIFQIILLAVLAMGKCTELCFWRF